jgi:hypothetical protein
LTPFLLPDLMLSDVERLLQRVERQRADAGHDVGLHQRERRPADVVIRRHVGAVVDAGENALGLLVVGVAGRRLRRHDVVAVRRGDRRVERDVVAVRVARGDRAVPLTACVALSRIAMNMPECCRPAGSGSARGAGDVAGRLHRERRRRGVRAADERQDAGAGEPAHHVAAERHVVDEAFHFLVDDVRPGAFLVARLEDDPLLERDTAVDVAHRDLEVLPRAAALGSAARPWCRSSRSTSCGRLHRDDLLPALPAVAAQMSVVMNVASGFPR